MNVARPFEDLSATGLLWLINRVALHPRGYALALATDEDGRIVGWTLEGTGADVYAFDPATDTEKFAAVQALLDHERTLQISPTAACGCPTGQHAPTCTVSLADQLARLTAAMARMVPGAAPSLPVTVAHQLTAYTGPLVPPSIPTQAGDPVRFEPITFDSIVSARPRFERQSFDASYESEATAAKRGL